MDIPPIKQFLRSNFSKKLNSIHWNVEGKVCDVVGNIIEAKIPQCPLGTIMEIDVSGSKDSILAEVVGFKQSKTLLLPFSELSGISTGALIRNQGCHEFITVGDFLQGKIVDPFLQSFTGEALKGPEKADRVPINKEAPNPLLRNRISKPISLGVRAIDGLLTFGEGQRIGLMAGSGVGKSVLMGMIARGSEADINVIGLIGERGREVREFLEKELGEDGIKKSIVVVVTSDQSPLMRIRGAKVVTAIAEYFSAKGKKVLLMMDSLTRVAQAQREIGLSVGEPPTSKAYPPSVFSLLPRLLERSGPQLKGQGSISGFYTVLVDGDDFNDPLPDAIRSILDGHINLSRSLANKGHFPAIEITSSVSRVMNDITPSQQQQLAIQIRELIATYEENFDFIQMGGYQEGTNPVLDRAIQIMPLINAYLRQPMDYLSTMEEAIHGLIKIRDTISELDQQQA
ncbi:MAG: FliI/YscN family ATPase [Oligoflexales bacterium]|nr:FliI/YscN family ATPase [Oligoflexales bacterium]